MLSRRTLIGSLAMLAVTSCGTDTTGPAGQALKSSASLQELSADSPAVSAIADNLRGLCWGWIREGDGNRLFSPSSFGLALGMLGEGATGESAKAIDEIFGVTGDERSAALGGWKQSLKDFDTLPDKVDVDDPPETPIVHLGAQAVTVGDAAIKQAYLDRLASHYGAGAVGVDSWEDLEPVLDSFAKRETAGLIDKSGIKPNPRIRLVLQDALLFAAAWAQAFEMEGTMEFRAPAGPIQVDSLVGPFTVPFEQSADATAVRLPFTDRFAMDVILPARDISSLSAESLQSITDTLATNQPVDVAVTMPASSQAGKVKLEEALTASGIVPGSYDEIFAGAEVDQFVQQTKLIVGAKGAIGAALTEVALTESAPAMPELEVIVDRPYALQVIDVEHGWPLFLSVITDPSQE